MNNKTFIGVIMILAVVSVISLMNYLPSRYAQTDEPQMADFPMKIGEWEGVDLPLSEKDYEILETKNLIMREYKNSVSQGVIYFYIVYSAGNRKVVHPPEICYSGGGSTIIEKSVVSVSDKIKANEFVVENKDTRQLVAYWFKTGDFNTYNYFDQQIKIMISRMLKRHSSGALIRVSTNIAEGKEADGIELIKGFVGQIEPLLVKYVP